MGSSNINSTYYTVGISNKEIYSDIYKIFYTILNNSDEFPVNRIWYSSFPDVDIESSSSYPIGIIESPDLDFNNFTQTKDIITTYVDIEIFVTKKEWSDSYASKILYEIRRNKHYLRKLGVKNLELESDEKDMIPRDRIKVHTRLLRFTFDIVKDKVSLSW